MLSRFQRHHAACLAASLPPSRRRIQSPTQKQPASVSKISLLLRFFFLPFLLQMTLRLFEFVRRSFRVTRVKGEGATKGGFCRLILLRFKEHSVIVEFPLHVFGAGV